MEPIVTSGRPSGAPPQGSAAEPDLMLAALRPAWLHGPIELPLLLLLRERLQQQIDTAEAALRPRPAAAALAPDGRSATAPAAGWWPARPTGDPRAARAALRRMAEGRYGRCVRCEQAIGRDRLLAQPATPICEACATGCGEPPPSPDHRTEPGLPPLL